MAALRCTRVNGQVGGHVGMFSRLVNYEGCTRIGTGYDLKLPFAT